MSAMALHRRQGPSPRAPGSRRRRRPPARRCRRCSSALRPVLPRKRSTRTSVSPSADVAQVADVRRLVRVDGRVLDDGLARLRRRRRKGAEEAQPRAEKRRPIEEHVQVAVGRGLDARPPRESAPICAASSWAMARGAFRRRRARSNATGVPRSPMVRLGGVSMAIVTPASSPRPWASARIARTRFLRAS